MRDIPDLAENGNFKEFENSISKRKYPIFINTIRVLYGFQEIYPDSNDRAYRFVIWLHLTGPDWGVLWETFFPITE